MSDLVILKTKHINYPAPPLGWSCCPVEHRQHVGVLSRRELRLIAHRADMDAGILGSLHVLSRGIGPVRRLVTRWSPARRLISGFVRSPPRLLTDHLEAMRLAVASMTRTANRADQ